MSLESRNSNADDLLVTSVGPAINRDPLKQNLPLKQRHLKSDLPNYISNHLSAKNGRLVVVPYPYAMDQVYAQELDAHRRLRSNDCEATNVQ